MSAEPQQPTCDPNDPATWPVADALPTDIFLGEFIHDCTPHLTPEQLTWPVADAIPADIFLGTFIHDCTPNQRTTADAVQPDIVVEPKQPPPSQPPPPEPP